MYNAIIKKNAVTVTNKQYIIQNGSEKIYNDVFIQQEKERLELEAKEEIEYATESENEQQENITEEENIEQEQTPQIDYTYILKQEYDKGFHEGRKSALMQLETEYKKRITPTINQLTNLIDSIKQEFDEYKKNLDRYIISLSIAIAEKIIKREVKIDSDIVIMQIKEAISKIIGVDSITIVINPNDEENLRKFKDEITNKFDNLKEINIQTNELIEQGSCKIESQLGNVDARFESQLKIIEEALLNNITSTNNNETI
ncbi:MAG TPA: FliH/SctL family protein [Ignavibacteria bacterium]|jgi:flagellar assembly protein FliH